MPALMIILARWVPPHERSRQGAIVFGGAQIGNIFGSFMSGFLMAGGGHWANVFYFFGLFGIVWFVFWVRLLKVIRHVFYCVKFCSHARDRSVIFLCATYIYQLILILTDYHGWNPKNAACSYYTHKKPWVFHKALHYKQIAFSNLLRILKLHAQKSQQKATQTNRNE